MWAYPGKKSTEHRKMAMKHVRSFDGDRRLCLGYLSCVLNKVFRLGIQEQNQRQCNVEKPTQTNHKTVTKPFLGNHCEIIPIQGMV